jgi:hypothetical protein
MRSCVFGVVTARSSRGYSMDRLTGPTRATRKEERNRYQIIRVSFDHLFETNKTYKYCSFHGC